MVDNNRITKLIDDLLIIEAPGEADWRDARMQAGQIHQTARKELLQIGGRAVPDLIEKISSDKVRALVREIGQPAIEPLVVYLVDNQGNKDPKFRHVATVLGELGFKQPLPPDKIQLVIAPLLNLLANAESVEEQIAFVRTLGRLEKDRGKQGNAQSFEAIFKLLNAEDVELLSSVSFALGLIGDKRAIDPLLNLLANIVERIEALPTEQTPFPDVRLCGEIASALGNFDEPRVVDPLIELLGAKNTRFRATTKYQVAGALGKIGDKRAIEPLIKYIQDDTDKRSKDALAHHLGQIKDPRVVSFLEKLCSENQSLYMAKKALQNLKK